MYLKSSGSKNKSRLLPLSLRLYLSRRLHQARGLAFVLGGALLTMALITAHPEDASLNNIVSTDSYSNILGFWGSVIHDFLWQSIHAWSLLLGLPFLIWGWEIMNFRDIRMLYLRFAVLPLSLIVVAMGTGASVGVSSVCSHMGYLVAEWCVRKTHFPHISWGVSGIFLLIGFAGYFFSLGLRDEQWKKIKTVCGHSIVSSMRLMYGYGVRVFSRINTRVFARNSHIVRPLQSKAPSIGPVDVVGDSPDDGVSNNGSLDSYRMYTPKTEEPPETSRTRAPASSHTQSRTRFPGALGSSSVAVPSQVHTPLQLPDVNLISDAAAESTNVRISKDALSQRAQELSAVLEDFGIRGDIVSVRPGPVVTLYELVPAPGIKSSRIIGLADDIARSMSAISARVSVIAGRNAIGIELPNEDRHTVYLKDLLQSDSYLSHQANLPLILGKDIGGSPIIADLSRMPHLLVAGTTGSGKSVAVNAMILSLVYRLTPDQCKFIMIDPKMLELSVYNGIPHLLTPVVTDPRKAVVALKWVVREMEDRYRAMSQLSVRNIDGYNEKIVRANKQGDVLTRRVQVGFDNESGRPQFEEQELDMKALPYIVVIVDEMADLMLVAGKDVEGAIQRLAQMARAAGIHIIMATQRPSVDVITGTIKANFPTRISFQVTSKIDSRTILGEGGAEQLLGQGDMLYMAGGGRTIRVHGPFVKDHDVESVANSLRASGSPSYVSTVLEENEDTSSGVTGFSATGGDGDDLFEKAVTLIQEQRKASTSFIQRHLKIGYNRAATIMDDLEKRGFVSEANHVGRREVLLPETDG
ncbi:MAG: DNA translocase FtsK 4TM domain-containing protein [Alphaproteobacteria bacterium]|nr:MAG: DNA translocase FtsK 4TM domain-containing protein [Alphaproteobacteria bacterium]